MSNQPPELNLTSLRKRIQAALRAWNTVGGDADSLLTPLLITKRALESSSIPYPASLRLATNEVLLKGIDELQTHDSEVADVLRGRFVENEQIAIIARQMHVSQSTVSRTQVRGIELLAAIILKQETEARKLESQEIESQLPPPTYSEVFGLEKTINELEETILHPTLSPVISIVGIGGIGKTTLADVVVRRIISQFFFSRIIWVRAELQTISLDTQSPEALFRALIYDLGVKLSPDAADLTDEERLTFVRQTLKNENCLVVIDNLESSQDMAYVLSEIWGLAGPSKFLVTSRTRSLSHQGIYNFLIPELQEEDARKLLFQQAKMLGIESLFTTISEDELALIYKLVGGNPLALKLIVNLLDFLPLPKILADLQKASSRAIEDMYVRIYLQAWKILSPAARNLLQAMPIVSDAGADADYLQSITQMSDMEFWPAVQELRNRSLLEIRGNMQEKLYGIHRLTRSFLHTQIINWPDTDDSLSN